MSDMMERHERIGQVLSAAFTADTPVMLDWAELGFAIKAEEAKLKRVTARADALQADRLAIVTCGACGSETATSNHLAINKLLAAETARADAAEAKLEVAEMEIARALDFDYIG